MFDASGLVSFDVSIERFDGRAHERLGLLLAVLALGQFQEDAASRKQWIGKPLLERSKTVPAILDISAKFDAVRLPFLADGVDIVDFDRDVLNPFAIFVDEFTDLRATFFIPALHERDLCIAPLDDHRVHTGFVATHVLSRPDDIEAKNRSEEGFRCGQVFHAEGDVINADGFFHSGSSYTASVER